MLESLPKAAFVRVLRNLELTGTVPDELLQLAATETLRRLRSDSSWLHRLNFPQTINVASTLASLLRLRVVADDSALPSPGVVALVDAVMEATAAKILPKAPTSRPRLLVAMAAACVTHQQLHSELASRAGGKGATGAAQYDMDATVIPDLVEAIFETVVSRASDLRRPAFDKFVTDTAGAFPEAASAVFGRAGVIGGDASHQGALTKMLGLEDPASGEASPDVAVDDDEDDELFADVYAEAHSVEDQIALLPVVAHLLVKQQGNAPGGDVASTVDAGKAWVAFARMVEDLVSEVRCRSPTPAMLSCR